MQIIKLESAAIKFHGGAFFPGESTPAARSYRRSRLRLTLARLALGPLLLAFLLASGAGSGLAEACRQVLPGDWGAFGLFLVTLALVWGALRLPMDVAGYLLERRHGMATAGPGRYAMLLLRSRMVEAAVGLVLASLLYALLRELPELWWLPMAGGLFLVGGVLAFLGPAWILPWLVPTHPLEDAEIRRRLEGFLEKEGAPALPFYRVELGSLTRKANAAFGGLGSSRRILLSDTLLDDFSPDEIEAVVAHEWGHQRLGHVGRGIFLGSCGSFLGLGVTAWLYQSLLEAWSLGGPADLASLPLLALLLVLWGWLVLPVQNAWMRRWEFQADRFAARRTSAGAMARALRRLGRKNLADPDPPVWEERLLHSHPSLRRRLEALREIRQGEPSDNRADEGM